MLRQVSAFFIAPLIVGALASLFVAGFRGDLAKFIATIIAVSGVVFVFTVLFVLPIYIWLRLKGKYTSMAITKVGTVVGGFMGLTLALVISKWAFLALGLFGGLVGSIVFHLIHGNIAITKSSKGQSLTPASPP